MSDILRLILEKIREPLSLRETLNNIECLVREELEREAVEPMVEEDIRGSWWFRFREALACWVAP